MSESNEPKLIGVESVVNPQNLALLRKGDRTAILAGGLVVVLALGAVTLLKDQPDVAQVLTLASIGTILALVVLVQFRAVKLRGVEHDLHAQTRAAKAVNGDWWQLVYASDHPGLSHLAIALADVAERHSLQGTTFDENGKHLARFSSDAIAIRTTTPVEIYYVWRGTVLGPEDVDVVSGIGRFRFDSIGREDKPLEAEGTFTRGTPEEMKFKSTRAVELVRFTEEESRSYAANSSCLGELAAKAYARFALEGGRRLAEAQHRRDG